MTALDNSNLIGLQSLCTGQPGVLGQLPVLAVDGDEIPGPGQVEKNLQISLKTVARRVHLGCPGVIDECATAVEVVDHARHATLVAGDDPG